MVSYPQIVISSDSKLSDPRIKALTKKLTGQRIVVLPTATIEAAKGQESVQQAQIERLIAIVRASFVYVANFRGQITKPVAGELAFCAMTNKPILFDQAVTGFHRDVPKALASLLAARVQITRNSEQDLAAQLFELRARYDIFQSSFNPDQYDQCASIFRTWVASLATT
jgi:hypothetical protein